MTKMDDFTKYVNELSRPRYPIPEVYFQIKAAENKDLWEQVKIVVKLENRSY